MQRASDIHLWIEPGGARAKFRIDGVMAAETTEFHEDEGREMVSSLLQKYAPGFSGYESDSRHIQEAIDLTIDVTYPTMVKSEKVRLRLDRTGSKDRKGYKATFRIQLTDKAAMNLEEAGYEPAMISTLKQMFDAPYGIFIATGKVNSGKSTTLFSMLEGISHAKSGISIEDPIEFKYTHPNITPIQVDNDDPKASLTAHLHSSLRKDPDFVNVAEIRTPEVAADVMGHARVGCVMSSTLHTNDAVTAFERLVEMGITAKELSNIDLSNNENLELISISENNISGLNISKNNNLNDLNALNNPMLKCIQVNTIQIANISNLNWKKDLSTNYSLNCEVNELSDVTIYNVITLNENGKNDYLVIKNIEYFPQNNMSIFNRDGTLISSIDKYGEQNRFFRGITKSNKELPSGSYIYIFNYYHPVLKKTIIKKGFLTIIND